MYRIKYFYRRMTFRIKYSPEKVNCMGYRKTISARYLYVPGIVDVTGVVRDHRSNPVSNRTDRELPATQQSAKSHNICYDVTCRARYLVPGVGIAKGFLYKDVPLLDSGSLCAPPLKTKASVYGKPFKSG